VSMTGMILGGVTPIGLPETLPIWVDARVMEAPYIILGGGNRESKLKISPRIFELTANTEVIDGLAAPKPPRPET
ncbi:MAG: YbaK/EbsC family protein, partial [Pseudomonadota bacterium]